METDLDVQDVFETILAALLREFPRPVQRHVPEPWDSREAIADAFRAPDEPLTLELPVVCPACRKPFFLFQVREDTPPSSAGTPGKQIIHALHHTVFEGSHGLELGHYSCLLPDGFFYL